MSIELTTQLFELCIIPLLAVLTGYAIQFIHVKTAELKGKTKNEIAKKYADMVSQTIEDCVIATNQTYVESLKAQNAFDKEAQEIAFNKTLNAVMAILSEDAKAYIRETSGDLTFYLTQQIEIKVNKTKNSIV